MKIFCISYEYRERNLGQIFRNAFIITTYIDTNENLLMRLKIESANTKHRSANHHKVHPIPQNTPKMIIYNYYSNALLCL